MKIATCNVNGIRAAEKKGFFQWVNESNIDVIGIQESKIQEKDLNKINKDLFDKNNYWCFAEKPGYSGVATFSNTDSSFVKTGMGIEKFDEEGRILRTDFDGFTFVNVYIPSGTMGEHRHEFKMEFLQNFQNYIEDLLVSNPDLIVVGDYNIVHQGIDIHNPDRKDNPSGYRPDERKWLDDWYNSNFVDAFRKIYPEKKQFSWWSYRAGAYNKNLGWRIDYISVSNSLKEKIKDVAFYTENKFSDHCPVIMDIDI
ncbi:MAG: exodeoxyribonuclease III [Saprospiraceae bacterium]